MDSAALPPDEPWFDDLARFLGPAYLRNAFTLSGEVAGAPPTVGAQ